jgi:hypothetical protein
MLTANHVRGLILEEAIVWMLLRSGYRRVQLAKDPSVHARGNDFFVRGRGADHQIDALMEHPFVPPFTRRMRLLAEAKWHTRPVGLSVVRNAFGVRNDAHEFFVGNSNGVSVPKQRHHYQSAIFSVSGFSKPAQRFAFAHDVFLVPLERSKFLRRLVHSLQQLPKPLLISAGSNLNASSLREDVREVIEQLNLKTRAFSVAPNSALATLLASAQGLEVVLAALRQVQGLLILMLGDGLPVVLAAASPESLSALRQDMVLDLHFDPESLSWLLSDASRTLFSFGLNAETLRLWLEQNGIRDGTFSEADRIEFFVCVYSNQLQLTWIKLFLSPGWQAVLLEGQRWLERQEPPTIDG